MRKIKLVNKERFGTFIGIVGLAIILVVAIKNPRKSPVQQWHEAIDKGMYWTEYTKEME